MISPIYLFPFAVVSFFLKKIVMDNVIESSVPVAESSIPFPALVTKVARVLPSFLTGTKVEFSISIHLFSPYVPVKWCLCSILRQKRSTTRKKRM